jgi:hypothetical protein
MCISTDDDPKGSKAADLLKNKLAKEATMNLSDLPASELVGIAANEHSLAQLLASVTGSPEAPFLHLDRILGAPRSGHNTAELTD